jgi:hypothetical protein
MLTNENGYGLLTHQAWHYNRDRHQASQLQHNPVAPRYPPIDFSTLQLRGRNLAVHDAGKGGLQAVRSTPKFRSILVEATPPCILL